ncbi:MAG: ubiquinol-cytochrome C chaperone family protein [Methyloceanibacter sp.]|uniref:ubiquinol-cytochrome C chaperone family protein n=1 Tax=Methyloceanibacter sp. TaxID=1965321 RepID=UPI003D6CF83E
MKPVASLLPWRRRDAHADEIYGAIVAQARLPVFYQEFGVPDTLVGRFTVLLLHLFAVLHRLNDGDSKARSMGQALADRFTADMETVLREIGIGDLSIPKKVRGLAASSAALLQDFEEALKRGDAAFAAAIARSLPLDETQADAVSGRLVPYVKRIVRHLEHEPLQDICAGELKFPKVESA